MSLGIHEENPEIDATLACMTLEQKDEALAALQSRSRGDSKMDHLLTHGRNSSRLDQLLSSPEHVNLENAGTPA